MPLRERRPGRRGYGWSCRFAARSPTLPQFLVLNEQRRAARLPIVNVDHLRLPGQIAREVSGGFGKENEPLRVVRSNPRRSALIERRRGIEIRLVDEVNRQASIDSRLQDSPRTRRAPSGKSRRQIELFDVRELVRGCPRKAA